MRVPLRLRFIWRVMIAAERVAQWCRRKWVKWHDNRGALLPGEDTPTPANKPKP